MIKRVTAPPMGWNSWDAYMGTPSEEEAKAAMRYMAAKLLPAGYEYFVLDAHWYGMPGARRYADEYGRPLPHPDMYPSSRNGNGFKPLADYAHSLGLRFGLHMMRGAHLFMLEGEPRVKGTRTPLSEIINPESPCHWSDTNGWYGVKTHMPEAQAWYDSLFELFASWGVDFVKYDDLAAPLEKADVLMIERAIEACGREMVLSLSPGRADISEHEFFSRHCAMWRVSGDFWDSWANSLKKSFNLLAEWNAFASEPGFPDGDMLPLGWLTERPCDRGVRPRLCRFTLEERRSLMTLFSVARSPLILSCNLLRNDDELLCLQTQPDCIAVNQRGENPRALVFGEDAPAQLWRSRAEGRDYLAAFNLTDSDGYFTFNLPQDLRGRAALEVWTDSLYTLEADTPLPIPAHGCALLRLTGEARL